MTYTQHFTLILHLYRMFPYFSTFIVHGDIFVIIGNFINRRITRPFLLFLLSFHLQISPEKPVTVSVYLYKKPVTVFPFGSFPLIETSCIRWIGGGSFPWHGFGNITIGFSTVLGCSRFNMVKTSTLYFRIMRLVIIFFWIIWLILFQWGLSGMSTGVTIRVIWFDVRRRWQRKQR